MDDDLRATLATNTLRKVRPGDDEPWREYLTLPAVLLSAGILVSWYDSTAELTRQYHLLFYPEDQTIEMFDLKTKRKFLARSHYPSIDLDQLFIGSKVTVYARQLEVVDYADEYTRSKLCERQESTLAMIKPDALDHVGEIVEAIERSGMTIAHLGTFHLTPEEAAEFYAEHQGKPFYDDLIAFISSDKIVAMEIVGAGAISRWRELIGPTNSEVARENAPKSLRARFGTDGSRNACHGSDSADSAARERDFFFGASRSLGAIYAGQHCSLCLIKPHAVIGRHAGEIIQFLYSEGFDLSSFKLVKFSKEQADEFMEAYKTVLPGLPEVVADLSSGPSLCIEVCGENVVPELRAVVGPYDPEIARVLSPESIRARFGKTRILNAVHCTDLEDDGPLECDFVFDLL